MATTEKIRFWTWLTRPRYSPLVFSIFFLLGFAVIAVGAHLRLYADFLTQRDLVAKTMLVSPLPKVTVTPRRQPPGAKTFCRPYEITRDMVTVCVPIWQELYEPYRGKPGVNYLEIGTFEGGSLVWMLDNILTNPTARATAIDFFQTGAVGVFPGTNPSYVERYYRNLQLSGAADKVTTINDWSQRALRKLPWDSFDIIYVDGSHVQEDVLEDAVLSWRLLKVGGLMVFDNYLLCEPTRPEGIVACPKRAIDPFVQVFERELEVIHNGDQLIVRKRS